ITFRREVDMRYVGQGHEIRVPLRGGLLGAQDAGQLKAAFEQVYRALYERLGPPVALEILNWRVAASGPRPDVHLQMGQADQGDAHKGQRQAFFPEAGGFDDTPVYDRYLLRPGSRFSGPAIVEERESTVIVGPGAQCLIDEQWNLVVEVVSSQF
ncbi:MAG TPA: hypothetical protein VFT99_01880, partial [Roseiflexaceae bacterium]|nr:hypothetical protein [Roseiflexaceae bacterium]